MANDTFNWGIPSGTDQSGAPASYSGDDASWTGLKAALLAGWVVAISSCAKPATLARELRRQAKAAGRLSHWHPDIERATVIHIWWS